MKMIVKNCKKEHHFHQAVIKQVIFVNHFQLSQAVTLNLFQPHTNNLFQGVERITLHENPFCVCGGICMFACKCACMCMNVEIHNSRGSYAWSILYSHENILYSAIKESEHSTSSYLHGLQ